jgi:hypothetical protein
MHRILFIIIIISSIVIACTSKSPNKPDAIQQFKGLKNKKLPNVNYDISVPSDYEIIENRGEDFSVYYINCKDSTKKAGFSASIYIGNFPSKFPVDDSCKASTNNGLILDEVANWETYDCKNSFFTQTLARNKNNHGWDQMIHAAGRSQSKAGIDTIMFIFSTLKPRKQ